MRNLYLIGMMGAGKSAAGRALAALLDLPFADLDARIEEKAGLAITEIFQTLGELYFRRLETDSLREVALRPAGVVATGGGIVLHSENVDLMKRTGRIIYLDASEETLWVRLKDAVDRPLLRTPDPRGTLKRIMGERVSFYVRACDLRIKTDGRTPEETAAEIVKAIHRDHEKHIR